MNSEDKENYLLAGRKDTPIAVLRRLTKSPSAQIRRRVAENESSRKKILEILSCDKHPDVRAEVALNKNTEPRIRWKLVTDEDPDVRFQIAEDPYTSIEILIWLSTDDNPYVAARASKTLESVLNDDAHIGVKGGVYMSAVRIERTLRRMLRNKGKLHKDDAEKLKILVLSDSYVSKSEQNILQKTISANKLNQQALLVFRSLLCTMVS